MNSLGHFPVFCTLFGLFVLIKLIWYGLKILLPLRKLEIKVVKLTVKTVDITSGVRDVGSTEAVEVVMCKAND